MDGEDNVYIYVVEKFIDKREDGIRGIMFASDGNHVGPELEPTKNAKAGLPEGTMLGGSRLLIRCQEGGTRH